MRIILSGMATTTLRVKILAATRRTMIVKAPAVDVIILVVQTLAYNVNSCLYA